MLDEIDVLCSMDEVGILEKGEGCTDPDEWTMYGYASTPAKDADDEKIIQKGLNLDPMLNHGWVNWDHDRANLIGWPTKGQIRKHPDTNKPSLYVEYNLIKGMPMAQRVYELATSLKKSKAPRSLGLSIEGKAQERSTQGTIVRADVYGFAVTPYAKNTQTSTSVLMKSILAGANPSDDIAKSEAFVPTGYARLEHLITDLSGIVKALATGSDIGGTTQESSGASRKEEVDSKPQYIEFTLEQFSPQLIENLPPRFLKAYEELEDIARRRNGKLTKGEAALLLHMATGKDIEQCLIAVDF